MKSSITLSPQHIRLTIPLNEAFFTLATFGGAIAPQEALNLDKIRLSLLGLHLECKYCPVWYLLKSAIAVSFDPSACIRTSIAQSGIVRVRSLHQA